MILLNAVCQAWKFCPDFKLDFLTGILVIHEIDANHLKKGSFEYFVCVCVWGGGLYTKVS